MANILGFYQHFLGDYRSGLLKNEKICLEICQDYIKGRACVEDADSSRTYMNFSIKFDDINNVTIVPFDKTKAIKIEGKQEAFYSNEKNHCIVYVVGLKNMEEAYDVLLDRIQIHEEEKERLVLAEKERERVAYEKEQARYEREQQSIKFYEEYYQVYLGEKNIPHYIFEENELKITALYVDDAKNINIIAIDGNKLDYTHAMIEADNIHYYEKAGAIHYTTSINGTGHSFGGSFTPAKWKATPSILGGLLFGTLGMTVGMIKGYKPSEYNAGSGYINITSTTEKIDDRNVILNYYSQAKRQYIDIELPQDIYNYLQTYLPDKKYDIVIEVEKHDTIYDKMQIESTSNKNIALASEESFKDRVDKLLLLKEMGLITEEEYEIKRKELLEMI